MSVVIMHPNDTKDRFVELRAQGLSLSAIAVQLHVSKRTLVEWNGELRQDVRALRAVELEALHERILASYEEQLKHLVGWQKKIQAELDASNFKFIENPKLLQMLLLVQGQIEHLEVQAGFDRTLATSPSARSQGSATGTSGPSPHEQPAAPTPEPKP